MFPMSWSARHVKLSLAVQVDLFIRGSKGNQKGMDQSWSGYRDTDIELVTIVDQKFVGKAVFLKI